MKPIFYFDFGSPNAYLAHRVLPAIEARTGVRFDYVPVLLGGIFKATGNEAPMQAFANVPSKLAYERRQTERFVAQNGLSAYKRNPHFPVNTLALMRGAVAADFAGVFPAYVEAMFHFMWEDPRKLDDPAILAATITEAGLPAERLLARSQEQAVKDRLIANTQAACAKGAFGIRASSSAASCSSARTGCGTSRRRWRARGNRNQLATGVIQLKVAMPPSTTSVVPVT